MKHPIRNLLFIILFAILVALGFGIYLYNKPHKKVESASVVDQLTADELFKQFNENEQAALAKYEEKVVEVEGEIYAVEMNANEPQIVLSTEDPSGFVRCGFQTKNAEQVQELKEGTSIRLKGFCMGMNKGEGLDLLSDVDVILSKCIIIE